MGFFSAYKFLFPLQAELMLENEINVWSELGWQLNWIMLGSMVGCKAMHLSTRNLGACLSFPPPPLYKYTHHTHKKVNFEILWDVIFDILGNIRVPVTFFKSQTLMSESV